MNCKNCGSVVPEGAKFCMECGTKVEVVLTCPSCGIQLPTGAKFCMECGSSVKTQKEDKFDSNLDSGPESSFTKDIVWEDFEKSSDKDDDFIFDSSDELTEDIKKETSPLKGVLETLDPVAFHWEYYNRRVNINHTAVNRKWIFCSPCGKGKKSYMMDENGENKVEFDIDIDTNTFYVQGMNNKGIWFMDCQYGIWLWDESEWWNKITCFNPETKEKKVIKFNSSIFTNVVPLSFKSNLFNLSNLVFVP